MMFNQEVTNDAKAHAVACYPQESCGMVVADRYIPCENVANDPLQAFEIAPNAYMLDRSVQAVIHSHPDGKREPTAADMKSQVGAAVPFGLLTVNAEGVTSDLLWWGPGVPETPLKGRPFRWGPSGSDGGGDCYALIRDYYKQELGIVIKEYPRDYKWWANDGNMYVENFADAGFVQIAHSEIKPGDVILMRVPSSCPVPNHAGIYLGPTQGILHHLQNRPSRQENASVWLKNITHYLRYDGDRSVEK